MKKQYQFRNLDQSTIDKLNKIKLVLKFKNLGELLTVIVDFYIKHNREKLNGKMEKF